MITLDQAKTLVSLLEEGNQTSANELVMVVTAKTQQPLYEEIGKLTRQVHNSLTEFRLDPRLTQLVNNDIPDVKNRLNFVISKTESAANTTMDAVEMLVPMVNVLLISIDAIRPQWNALTSTTALEENTSSFRDEMDKFLADIHRDAKASQQHIKDILIAQEYQDITGQVIRRVIELIHEVECHLLEIVKTYGDQQKAAMDSESVECGAEGPIVSAEERTKKQVVANQDEVDDLLSSLGF